jgi:hypothetical protein
MLATAALAGEAGLALATARPPPRVLASASSTSSSSSSLPPLHSFRRRAPPCPRAARAGSSTSQQQQPPVGKMRGNIDAWHGADFPRQVGSAAASGVVPGAGRTVATPTLSPELAFERLLAAGRRGSADSPGAVAAFFSSEMGGIVTEPGLAAVHADDHWLHSGHGACERVPLAGGALYQLGPRLARLYASSRAVGVRVPLEPAALARVVLDTAAASRLMNGEKTV